MLARYSDIDLFNGIFDSLQSLDWGTKTKSVPPSNIFERQGGYEIKMLVPGYVKSDIKVAVQADSLTVSGEKNYGEENPIHKEYSNIKFSRKFALPRAVNRDAITAHCENGILTVNVPTKDKELTKLLEVQVQ